MGSEGRTRGALGVSATAVLLTLALAACDVLGGGDQDQSGQAGQGQGQQQGQAEGGEAEASEDAEPATAGGRVGGGEPIASSETGGLVLEIYELRRTGDSMTLIFGVSAEEDDVMLYRSHLAEGGNSATGAALVDTVNHQRYRVLEDADGNCVCSTGYTDRMDTGERVKLSAAFPAAPDDVDRLSVQTPKFPQIDDVPISDG